MLRYEESDIHIGAHLEHRSYPGISGIFSSKHRYHPTTQQVDKQAAAGQASAAQDDEAIAAYSDTTATDTTDYADVDDNANRAYHSKYSLGNYDDPFDFIGSVFGGGALSVIVIFCIIFGLLFVFAPLIIVFLVYQISDSPPQRPDEVGGDGDGEGHQCSGKATVR